MSIETKPRTSLPVEDVIQLLDDSFPGLHSGGRTIFIESVAPMTARVRLKLDPRHLRPGGTLSGPAMFQLADFAIYAALVATLGAPGIPAVTSNLNINFLLRPDPVDAIAEARIIRLGRRLAYAEVYLTSDGKPDVIAHATGSYAVPKS